MSPRERSERAGAAGAAAKRSAGSPLVFTLPPLVRTPARAWRAWLRSIKGASGMIVTLDPPARMPTRAWRGWLRALTPGEAS